MVEEGVLERRVGSGTFVSSTRVQERMRGTTSFTEIVKAQGKTPSSHLISYRRTIPNEQEVAKLGLLPLITSFVWSVFAMPTKSLLSMKWRRFLRNLSKISKKEEVTKHFFQTLQEHGYRIGKSHQTIYARLAKEKIAHYLEVEKGHAILGLTQVSYFDDGTAFEYVKSQYVGERFEFYLENN